MKTTYLTFRTWSESTSKFRMFKNGIEFLGTEYAESQQDALISIYGKMDDQNYFPNDDLTEIADCDGHIIWEEGDSNIDRGDCSYYVSTQEDLDEDERELCEGYLSK
jgi:hypothetical protein